MAGAVRLVGVAVNLLAVPFVLLSTAKGPTASVDACWPAAKEIVRRRYLSQTRA